MALSTVPTVATSTPVSKTDKSLQDAKDYIFKLYYNESSPYSFSTPYKIYRYVKTKFPNITLKNVTQYLQSLSTYTLHRNSRKKFKRMKTKVYGVNQLLQADLLDMQKLAPQNNNIRYLLIFIDVFSKFVRVFPLKKKSQDVVFEAFQKLINNTPNNEYTKPVAIQTDAGTEFINSKVQKLLQENNIRFYTSKNFDIKAAVIERFNRTMRSKIRKYLHANNTKKYIDALPALVSSYNNSVHSSHNFKPSDVTIFNQGKIFSRLYSQNSSSLDNSIEVKFKFPINSPVRVSIYIPTIATNKQTNQQWNSDEYFVAEHLVKDNLPIYKLKDRVGNIVTGRYYEQELAAITLPQKELKDIEGN